MATDSKPSRKAYHEQIAERLIEQLEQGTAPWQKPWKPGEITLPYNGTTQKPYRGSNSMWLAMQGRGDPRWMTYNQAKSVGAQVRKGEKGSLVEFWQFSEEKTKLDAAGKPVLGPDEKPIKYSVELERPRVMHFVVFNAEQIDGLAPLTTKQIGPEPERYARAETILVNSGAKISHVEGDRAFYRPSSDSITLPNRDQFGTPDRYYATALHEVGHWTGHPSRLDRDLSHPFGSEGYAREELRAEIASLMLGEKLEIGHDPGQHAAYVGSWIKALKEDPMEIVRASRDAEKILGLMMSYEQTQEISKSQTPEQDNVALRDRIVTEITANERQKLIVAEQAYEQANEQVALASDNNRESALNDLYTRTEELAAARSELESAVMQALDKIEALEMRNKGPSAALDAAEAQISEMLAAVYQDGQGVSQASERVYLKVPYSEKEEVKALGAKWDRKEKSWFVSPGMDTQPFEKWAGKEEHKEKLASETEQVSEYLENLPEQTLAAMIENHGWHYHNEAFPESGLVRQFDGVGPNGVNAPKGERNFSLSYNKNEEQGIYIAVRLADTVIADFTGKSGDPEDVAQRLNERAERFADSKRLERGLDPLYSVRAQENAELFEQGKGNAPDVLDATTRVEVNHEAGNRIADLEATKTYLAIPYQEKDAAKANGAKWDSDVKAWYAPIGSDLSKLEKWLPGRKAVADNPAVSVEDEFKEALKSLGCLPDADRRESHPIMDGKQHRIPVQGDKGQQRSGFYIVHTDGRAAGFIMNNKTGEQARWTTKGQVFGREESAALRAQAAQKKALRDRERSEQYAQTADRLSKQFAGLPAIADPTPYMKAKGIDMALSSSIKAGRDGATIIPLHDIEGRHWNTQYIQRDGTKRFAKDSRKDGCFHVIGGQQKLDSAKSIVICEGFATGASIQKALPDAAIVVAFDSGNLSPVAKDIAAKYPNTPKIVAGDDDAHTVMTNGANIGRTKAEAAAEEIGAVAVIPTFAASEKSWPANVPTFTPEQFRAGELTDQQTAALSEYKRLTDFNDLGEKSTLGMAGLTRQLEAGLSRSMRRDGQAEQNVTQEQTAQQVRERTNSKVLPLPSQPEARRVRRAVKR